MKKPLNIVRKLSTVSEFTSSKVILSAALVVGCSEPHNFGNLTA